jgi:hypothetical protein
MRIPSCLETFVGVLSLVNLKKLEDRVRSYNPAAMYPLFLSRNRVCIGDVEALLGLKTNLSRAWIAWGLSWEGGRLRDHGLVDSLAEPTRLPHDDILVILLRAAMVVVDISKIHGLEQWDQHP